jgi:O-methyltransferase
MVKEAIADGQVFTLRDGCFIVRHGNTFRVGHVDQPLDLQELSDGATAVLGQLAAGMTVGDVAKWYGLVTGRPPKSAYEQVGQLLDSLIAVNLLTPLGCDASPALRDSIFEIPRVVDAYPDLVRSEPNFLTEVKACLPYTLTSIPLMFSAWSAVRYLVENDLPGDIVECGVWRGGTMMLIAKALIAMNDVSRDLYLYDTFEWSWEDLSQSDGMVLDSGVSWLGVNSTQTAPVMATGVDIDDVRQHLLSTGYPSERAHFVKGLVQETIPAIAPERIALLRLDTDFYESTRHELIHLYPNLAKGGVLIIDDYGKLRGATEAVDEYFRSRGEHPLLHRVDTQGRVTVRVTSDHPESKEDS